MMTRCKMYKPFKRLLDIVFSTVTLIVLAIPLLIIALLIKIDSRGPVFFKQLRLGKKGKKFKMLKFRSMIVNAENGGVYSDKKDKRVTRMGKFLRATSLDEIPQLFNVIKGDMSLIGPRPVLTYHPWEYEEYSEEEKKRFNVRPGLTGLAQVNGRRAIDWETRLKYDVKYVNKMSFLMDTGIFFKTIWVMLFGRKKNYNTSNDTKKRKGKPEKRMPYYLDLMYITNDTMLAQTAEECGVNIIFIDLESEGKADRQYGRDTVISNHKLSDVARLRPFIKKSKILVRVNSPEYTSRDEIDTAIESGADIVMLPYYKTNDDVRKFVNYVNGRAKVWLLLETPEAVDILDETLTIKGIDRIHIGLNDLHIGYKKKFMFELLTDGTVEKICNKIKPSGIPYGIGGIARLGKGMVKSDNIIVEHHRLGSTSAILSRSFYDIRKQDGIEIVRQKFVTGIEDIRRFETLIGNYSPNDFEKNRLELIKQVEKVTNEITVSGKA